MSRGGDAGLHDAVEATARALRLSVDELDSALDSDRGVEQAWPRLDEPQRAVLTAIAELGGAAPPSRVESEVALAAAAGLEPALPAAEEAAAIAAGEALESLWNEGLVQRDRGTRDAWLLPALARSLMRRRVKELSDELPIVDAPQPEPDEHLLLCAFSVLREEPLALTRAGKPHRRSLDRFDERLAALIPPGSSERLLTELRRHGLARLVDGELRTDEAAAAEWASVGRRERAARLLDSEWSRPEARSFLRQLRVLPDRRWPAAAAACTWRRWRLRVGGPEDAAEGPEREIAVLRSAGLLAVDPGDGALALTALGRSWPEPAAAATSPSGIHVGNDLSVLVPRGLHPAVHLRVSRAARLEAGDVVARYRLEREAFLAALDAGEHADELLAFLESRAEPRLPAAVKGDLERWCRRFGEITAHAGIAVCCEAHARREEFGALVDRSELAVRLIAPGVAIVAPEDHEGLIRELTAAGFTPRRSILEPRLRPGPGRAAAQASAVPLRTSATAALEWSTLSAWDGPPEGGRGRSATPPPSTALARVKEKYRREFGRSELAALDVLDVEELLEMEERGTVRRYLSGAGAGERSSAGSYELAEHEGPELIPTSPRRAAAVLELCAERGRRCEIAWRGEGGRRTVQRVLPVAVLEEAGIRYARLRGGSGGEERLVALDRILALRVISTQS